MALRLFLQHCLSAPSKLLSAQLPSSAALLQGITSTCHFSSVPSHTAYAALHPRICVRIFSTSPVCRVTFNVQDEEDFEERVIKCPTPVIVDFHAQWCGPCKILAPRLERLVAQQNGKVVMAKVDIDDHTDLALAYEVSAVPTVVAVKCGKVVDKFVGLMDEKQLEVFVKKLVG